MNAPDLPLVGQGLSNVASILLRASEEDYPTTMASFVHQAHVRRDVVVELIEGAQGRCHRSYRHINIDAARKKAEELPENGVPPQDVRLLPHDASLNHILIQNAAAPVEGRGSLEAAGACLDNSKANAVVEGKSGCDDADINAQRIEAVRSINERLTGEPLIINIDTSPPGVARASESVESPAKQLQVMRRAPRPSMVSVWRASPSSRETPWGTSSSRGISELRLPSCSGTAQACPTCTISRRRSGIEGHPTPRVLSPPAWVRIMVRRVEAQLSRGWHLGFVSWNYLFWSGINVSRTFFLRAGQKGDGDHGIAANEWAGGAQSVPKRFSGLI